MYRCIYRLYVYNYKKTAVENMPQIKRFIPSDTSGFCTRRCIYFLMVFAVSPESTFFAIHTVTNMLLCV